MPHLTAQYTSNLRGLDIPAILARINQTVTESGLFSEADIKSRAVPLDAFKVGVSAQPRAFFHLVVAMSALGDSVERQLAQSLADALDDLVFGTPGVETQICVEIIHVRSSTYVKQMARAAAA
ncbi:5-carboxymethyl-2-hydroxymuconate Delta-isomerase [Lacisediminimonas sp.]|uniref:5-carboxymethyl-2-hydroxymuconate Delta-isomerase n=1 Tax=Lacisediminimonas sp. TaxID=3060582 RepID=UPI0027177EDD|nr:hypothetical protein [Lacisediminimonas sp.]MDO8299853.1 hypothetical protein [Lacisediminimonas sp.]MDO9217156.1 hypothetical protein [Lacisediminimonas sp.]